MKPNDSSRTGSTLVMALLLIAVLSMVVSAYYQTLVPKYRSIYQGSSWQEALHGAEAGADYTLSLINTWAASTKDPDAYPWTTSSWTLTDSNFATNGERTLAGGSLPSLGGSNNVRVTKIAVDVYTRENLGAQPSYNPWFRIRSTARATLPGRCVSADGRDALLRRMNLDAKIGATPDPHVTRTVEIIVRPRYRFNRAITVLTNLSLGTGSTWEVDSFDSSDTAKSDPGTEAGGIYPASTPAEVQSNGGIASAKPPPAGTPYGPLISGNGAVVKGDVQTFGGDDPTTSTHENVSGSSGMTQSRIRDDYSDDLQPVTAPAWTTWTYQGPSNNPPGGFTTGSSSATPRRYAITGNLGTFAVTAPPAGTTGWIEIIVTGNLSTGNATNAGITIPPNVYATIWVQGNVDFGNGSINSNANSSKVASHLSVYGTGPAGSTYSASGSGVDSLTFYGLNYAATVNGTVETTGSMVVGSLSILGGGNGGFHYDEALGRGGDISAWQMASYFEDVRSDL